MHLRGCSWCHTCLIISESVNQNAWMVEQGRATVQMDIKLKEARSDGVSGGVLKIVADGYNAPVTAGNFIDLVQRGFYNNMEIQRADGFIVQTGDPGPEQVLFGYSCTPCTALRLSLMRSGPLMRCAATAC